MFFKKLRQANPKTPVSVAIDFEAQLAQNANQSKRIAWAIASCCMALTGLAITALILLIPLKQTVPYLTYVDKDTGVTQVVEVATVSKITQDEVNAKHWVGRYAQTRERYVYQLLQDDYDFIVATTDVSQQKAYSAIYQAGPNKKDALLRDQVEERIRVVTVQLSPSQTGRASVRYVKDTYRAGSRAAEKSEAFVADMAFEWSGNGQWTEKSLLINPLGFRVTAYRVTPEVAEK
jgi:type IV secretion system protein VirB8